MDGLVILMMISMCAFAGMYFGCLIFPDLCDDKGWLIGLVVGAFIGLIVGMALLPTFAMDI